MNVLCYYHFHCSILFADIVNFTPLTSSLSPYKLIVVLNELFGKFDVLAEVCFYMIHFVLNKVDLPCFCLCFDELYSNNMFIIKFSNILIKLYY